MSNTFLCSVTEAARLLGVGRSKTYDMLAKGELTSILIGTRRLVKMDSIERFIELATNGVS